MRGTGTSQDCSPAPHRQGLTSTHCSFSSHYSEYFTSTLMDTAPHRSSNTHHPKKNPHTASSWAPIPFPAPGAASGGTGHLPHCPPGGRWPNAAQPSCSARTPQAQAASPRGNFSIFHGACGAPWLRALAGASSSPARRWERHLLASSASSPRGSHG